MNPYDFKEHSSVQHLISREVNGIHLDQQRRSLGIEHNRLVVEPYPTETYEFVNWDDEIPNTSENKTCSKPLTR